jgi:hypothetical protein
MDWVEIGIGLLIMLVAIGGVLIYSLTHQQAAIEAAKKPELPPTRGPGSAENARGFVVELEPVRPLAGQLRVHAERAALRGLRPYLEVGAVWCPPSKLFGEALTDPRLEAALTGVYLIRVDLDAFTDDPTLSELGVEGVPVFFELDVHGEATGRTMTGAAWGADTVENMAAAVAKFCA